MAIDIDNLTVKELREICRLACGTNSTPTQSKRLPMPIGTKVFVRTVTHHFTGRVTACAEEEVELSDAAWIADDGSFNPALVEGKLAEVEPYPQPITLNRGAFIEWTVWTHELPRSQK